MTKKRPLIIDCQVFQTASWHRGMGKYSHALLEAMMRDNLRDKYNIILLFNTSVELPTEIKRFVSSLEPAVTSLYLPLVLPPTPREERSVKSAIDENKSILNRELSSSYGDFDMMIMALYLDEVCAVFSDVANEKILIYYDSIPYLYHERYAAFEGFFDNFYFPHTATVYEATKLLTISKTVANDLCITFGIPKSRLFNINGAAIPRDAVKPEKPKLALTPAQYILMPTGQELRKNNKRAAQGFALYKQNHPESPLKLVVTSTFTNEGKAEMTAYSDDIVFTGNVSEGTMKWLFDNCAFLVFPSEYEGLGLPVLEAIDSKKQIACSDISVFRELSATAFLFFDPLDPESIAAAIEKEVANSHLPEIAKEYVAVRKEYTWERSARAVYGALSSYSEKSNVTRKKIAIFCPDASGFSAIGKVITESHARYSEYFDITYYFDKGPNHRAIRPNPLAALAPCYDIEKFTSADYEKFDEVIYHIGNSEYHLNIIHLALVFPGYVVLHDTFLGGAYANLLEAGYITQQRYDTEARLDELLQGTKEEGRLSGYLTSLLNRQKGVIVHSEYARRAVKDILVQGGRVKIKHLNLPVSTPLFPDIVTPNNNKLTISFAGIIASVKGTDVMEDIANSDEYDDCNVNIFGYSAVEPDLLARLSGLPHVKLVTNPSDYDFQRLMAGTDILINVRLAYRGETSLTTLESMRFGGVAVIRDFGWYSELPDDAVVKVDGPSDALSALSKLVSDKGYRQEIGARAIEHIHRDFSHNSYALGMYNLMDK
jgi:glycosyltransferase involved in cell wall biosynthesis